MIYQVTPGPGLTLDGLDQDDLTIGKLLPDGGGLLVLFRVVAGMGYLH